MKYSLSPRKILRAEPEGFSKGSVYISLYILTQVIIQTLSISKTPVLSFLVGAILVELIFRIALAAGPIFSSIFQSGPIFFSIPPAELGEYLKILPS